MDKSVLYSPSPLPLVLIFFWHFIFYCIHSYWSRNKKLQRNFWTLLVIVKSKKPVKNTSEEAKFLVKLLAYSPEYTTKRWTSSVSKKLSNTLKILVRNRLLHFLHITVLTLSLEYQKEGWLSRNIYSV